MSFGGLKKKKSGNEDTGFGGFGGLKKKKKQPEQVSSTPAIDALLAGEDDEEQEEDEGMTIDEARRETHTRYGMVRGCGCM